MSKIIEQLWNGRLEPIDALGKNNAEIQKLEMLIQRHLEKLVFQKYNGCMEEYMDIIREEAFCGGFCLGTRLTAEALLRTEETT